MSERKGRPRVTETIPVEKILKAYEVEGSTRRAAKRLGITHPTVARVLKENGVEVKPVSKWQYDPRLHAKKTKSSSFARWLRDNPEVVLPRSIKQISEMSECTYAAVNCFLYRRRKPIKDKLRQLPDLKELAVLMLSKGEVLVNTRDFKNYRYEVDSYDLKTQLVAQTSKFREIRFPIADYESFCRRVWEITADQTANGYSQVRLSV